MAKGGAERRYAAVFVDDADDRQCDLGHQAQIMGFLIPYFDRVVCPSAIVGVQNQQVSDICFLPAGVDLASQAPQDCARQLHGLSWPPRIKLDRKSTRLNSSHRTISYAVFCLKKKTQ